MLRASELFASAHSCRCEGSEECHWCGAACGRLWLHDDPFPIPFLKNQSRAVRPSSPFICMGCWLWRRKRTTVFFPDGSYRDGQCAMDHSWYVPAEGSALALRRADFPTLKPLLLEPKKPFLLSVLSSGHICRNELHLCTVNEHREFRSDTPLYYTHDNVKYQFTTYELEEGLKKPGNGKEGGVRILCDLLRGPEKPPALVLTVKPKPNTGGRPSFEDSRKGSKKLPALVSGNPT